MRGLYAAAAGGIAGSSVSFLLHPLDTLKTMSQADKTHRFWQLGAPPPARPAPRRPPCPARRRRFRGAPAAAARTHPSPDPHGASALSAGMDAVRKHGLYHGLYAGARTAALGSFISSGL